MANADSTSGVVPAWQPLTATPSGGSYLPIGIRQDASPGEVAGTLSMKLHHLEAMLMAMTGDSNGEPTLSQEMQQNLLWACTETASECRAIFDALLARGLKMEGGEA